MVFGLLNSHIFPYYCKQEYSINWRRSKLLLLNSKFSHNISFLLSENELIFFKKIDFYHHGKKHRLEEYLVYSKNSRHLLNK